MKLAFSRRKFFIFLVVSLYYILYAHTLCVNIFFCVFKIGRRGRDRERVEVRRDIFIIIYFLSQGYVKDHMILFCD